MAYEVVVRRANGAAWWLKSFRVDIDGRAVGRVRPGRVLSTEVAAGRHRVQVFVGSNSSNPVDFDAVDDDHLALFVRPADLKLALAGFIVLGIAHSVIGMVLLVPSLAIFIWQAVALLHATRRAKRT